jgi:Phage integrase, N-terminal SAM-like domain
MAKEKTGSLKKRNGRWIARVTYVGNDGRRKSIQKSHHSKPEAKKLLKGMLAKLESKGEESAKAEKLLFRDVAERYSTLKTKPPKFRGDKVIEGMRSYAMVKIYLRNLLSYFGAMKLTDITPGVIQSYKQHSLSLKTNRGGEYSVAAVNRRLQLLRAILNFAKQEGGI